MLACVDRECEGEWVGEDGREQAGSGWGEWGPPSAEREGGESTNKSMGVARGLYL